MTGTGWLAFILCKCEVIDIYKVWIVMASLAISEWSTICRATCSMRKRILLFIYPILIVINIEKSLVQLIQCNIYSTYCYCQVTSVVSDSVWPHRQQPTRLPRPWDSPGKNTGVGCHFLLQWVKVKSKSEVTQSCPTLSDPMDCSLPGSSIHGIFQARVLEWGAIAFSY